MAARLIKVTFIGDDGVGKTRAIRRWAYNENPGDFQYLPMIMDNVNALLNVDGIAVEASILEAPGHDAYDRLRPLHFPNTNVFVVCFACDNTVSLERITSKWIPEISLHCPGVPLIICCTKIDLRDTEHEKIKTETGVLFSRSVGAAAYVECSSLSVPECGTNKMAEIALKVGLGVLPKGNKLKPAAKSNFAKTILSSFKSFSLSRPHEELLYNRMSQCTALSGHSSVIMGTKLFVIGGCNEKKEFNKSIYLYHTLKREWEAVEGVVTPYLQFHTSIAHKNNIFIFGGRSAKGYRNECYKFDIDTNQFTRIEAKGSVPAPRYGHSAVVFKEKMYVFGGYNNQPMICDDLYSLDLVSENWERIKTNGSLPSPRFSHSASIMNDFMVVFGGCGDHSIVYSDIYQYDFESATWTRSKMKGKALSRFGHTAVSSPHGMYVYGGTKKTKKEKERDKFYSSVYYLSTKNASEWLRTDVKGVNNNHVITEEEKNNNTLSRAFHSSVWNSELDCMHVIGGKNESFEALSNPFSLSIIKSGIDSFPNFILFEIIKQLDYTEITALMKSCKRFHKMSGDEQLWQSLCEIRFSDFPLFNLSNVQNSNFNSSNSNSNSNSSNSNSNSNSSNSNNSNISGTFKFLFSQMSSNPDMTISVPSWGGVINA